MAVLICNIVIGVYFSIMGMALKTNNTQSFLIFKGIPWTAGLFLIITSAVKIIGV
jgi:hypothetical protein